MTAWLPQSLCFLPQLCARDGFWLIHPSLIPLHCCPQIPHRSPSPSDSPGRRGCSAFPHRPVPSSSAASERSFGGGGGGAVRDSSPFDASALVGVPGVALPLGFELCFDRKFAVCCLRTPGDFSQSLKLGSRQVLQWLGEGWWCYELGGWGGIRQQLVASGCLQVACFGGIAEDSQLH
ncbi:hypothetical protein Taro_012257 [Colocasia esculenta]|uniref:Uncharacterized protein n=1 Tax=Colocasia esculenta TaxID=4460 RepID=A0A843UF27_COLES|nr:hypothetical protein [Colocasia esculenta]